MADAQRIVYVVLTLGPRQAIYTGPAAGLGAWLVWWLDWFNATGLAGYASPTVTTLSLEDAGVPDRG